MRTTLEKPEIVRLIGKSLGIKNLDPNKVHVQADPFEVTITHDALVSAIPAKDVVKEHPEPVVSSPSEPEPQEKRLRRPVLSDTPLGFSELMDHNTHVPRPDKHQIQMDSKSRSLRVNEFIDVPATDNEGKGASQNT